jgi:mono/diheme cytochrome c family protein
LQFAQRIFDGNPSVRMRAGRMPAVDTSPGDMFALLAWLAALGTPAQNVPAVYHLPSVPPVVAAGANRLAAMGGTAPLGTSQGGSSSQIAASIADRQVFQERACFACHGQAGAGGRAPALAPLVSHLADPDLTQLLQNPNARMRAGGMPPVVATPDEIGALISYLRTLPAPQPGSPPAAVPAAPQEATLPEARPAAASFLAANAPPPAPRAVKADVALSPERTAGRALFLSQGCIACHGLNAQGTRNAPSLLGVADRFPGDKLPALLHHPTNKMRDGGMPPVAVNEAQMLELVAYLSSLQSPPPVQPNSPANADLRLALAQPAAAESFANPSMQAHPVRRASLDSWALRGQHVFERNVCGTCHGAEGLNGTAAAPGLAGTVSMLPSNALENLLRHQSARMRKGGMPLTNLSDADMKAIVAYIRALSPAGEEQSMTTVGPANQRSGSSALR